MNTKIFTFANQKGGAGKTTCAMLVADALSRKNARVLVVDTDPQGSAHKWESKSLEGFKPYPVRVESVSGLNEQEFARWLQKRLDNVDYIIIDTPPNLQSTELRAALFLAHQVVIPWVPHAAFLDALEEVQTLINKIESLRDGVPLSVNVLVNKFAGRRSSERSMVDFVTKVSPWPIYQTQLKDLAGFADAYNFRTSVFELCGPKDPARLLLEALTEEMFA